MRYGLLLFILLQGPAAWCGAGLITVHPEESDALLNNPGTAWIYYDYGKTPYAYDFPEATCVMHSRQWADIEPTEGACRWDELKQRVAHWAARGKKSMIRIMNAYPGIEFATPKWVFDAGAQGRHYDSPAWGKGFEPCYWDPVFKKKLRRFLREFGRQFDGNPDILSIDIRNYGWWGEWHSNIEWPKGINKRKVLEEYIDIFARALFT